MKALFYILALLVAGGAAVLSYNNWQKFTEQQKIRISVNKEIEEVVKVSDDATRKELASERKKLGSAREEQSVVEQNIETLKAKAAELVSQMKESDDKLAEQAQEDKQLKDALDEAMKIVKELGGDVTVESLPDKMKELAGKKTERESKLEELTALCEAATKKLASDRAEVDRLVQRDGERSTRIRRNSMESVLTAVNQEWGFVVVGAGSNTGFTPQTKLLVKRDGFLIGKLQPTSIEANQTIADIDLESLAPGVRLQPGDRVLLSEPATN
jgi:peptidoglycan hydrolase CwlO-like protein